jgi:two-component system response regulator
MYDIDDDEMIYNIGNNNDHHNPKQSMKKQGNIPPGLKKILIVEDSDDDYEITEIALRDAKFDNQIIRCNDGKSALSYINDDTAPYIGLILLDLNMPGLDGHTILKQIKSHPEYKKIPVIILTTSTDTRDINECYLYGANTYIQKSMNYNKFKDTIQVIKDYWFVVATI